MIPQRGLLTIIAIVALTTIVGSIVRHFFEPALQKAYPHKHDTDGTVLR
jgi:hypothetical protein